MAAANEFFGIDVRSWRIADFTSEVLELGAMPSSSDVVPLAPDRLVANGARIG